MKGYPQLSIYDLSRWKPIRTDGLFDELVTLFMPGDIDHEGKAFAVTAPVVEYLNDDQVRVVFSTRVYWHEKEDTCEDVQPYLMVMYKNTVSGWKDPVPFVRTDVEPLALQG